MSGQVGGIVLLVGANVAYKGSKQMNVELSLADMELIITALKVQYEQNPQDRKLIAITAKRMLEMRDEQIDMLKKVYA